MAKLNKTVIAELKKIQESGRVDKATADKLIPMGLIEVNSADIVDDKAAARLTPAGLEGVGGASVSANAGGSTGQPSKYAIITNAVLPESKRGFGRKEGESKYPFADLQVNGMFFVPNADVAKGDALKSLTSAVSNANNKYRTDTGSKRTVTRKVKGGNGETETVELPVYKADRKFSIRGVKGGEKYGDWVAPADGALIARTL